MKNKKRKLSETLSESGDKNRRKKNRTRKEFFMNCRLQFMKNLGISELCVTAKCGHMSSEIYISELTIEIRA